VRSWVCNSVSDSDLAGWVGEREVEREGNEGRGMRREDEVELERNGDLVGVSRPAA
jgi:hypothetical protein